MKLAINTQELTRTYPNGQGVRNLELRVPQNSIYGFLGPNGAGKTTTIRLLLGLLRPQQGSIELLGERLHINSGVLSKIGALVESPSLYPHLSGRQNLEVTRRLLGLSRTRIDECLEITQLTDAADRRVGEYSLGMSQRLGIALALLGKPELLILDEPSNGLDPAGMRDLRQTLRTFTKELGMTVLVSSHLLGEIEQVATHVGVLQAGVLRFQGSISELQARSRPRVRLRCGNPELALSWLRQQGHPEAVIAGGWIVMPSPTADVPRLIHASFNAGFELLDIALEAPSLETTFLGLTDAGEPAETRA